MRTAVTAAWVLVAASAARIAAAAPPSLTPLSDPEEPPARTAELAEPAAAPLPSGVDLAGPKSEATATALAFGTTAAGWALALAAAGHNSQAAGDAALTLIVVGPSAGHIYAGETMHALGMSALRTGGLVTLALGVFAVVVAGDGDGAKCELNCGTGGYDRTDHSFATGAMLVGGTAFVVGTAYDLFDAHRAARRANAKLLDNMTVAPTMIRVPNGMAPGMALTGSF